MTTKEHDRSNFHGTLEPRWLQTISLGEMSLSRCEAAQFVLESCSSLNSNRYTENVVVASFLDIFFPSLLIRLHHCLLTCQSGIRVVDNRSRLTSHTMDAVQRIRSPSDEESALRRRAGPPAYAVVHVWGPECGNNFGQLLASRTVSTIIILSVLGSRRN